MSDIEIICGDCREIMATLAEGSVAAIVTDPPYGTDVERDGYGRRQIYDGKQHIAGDADLATMAGMLAMAPRVLARNAWVAVFCSPKRRFEAEAVVRASGFGVFGEIVWDKQQPGLGAGIRYQHETVLLCSAGKPSGKAPVFSVLRHGLAAGRRGKGHPHEKPVGLMASLVRYCCPADGLIPDPFAGSGSTLVAAAKSGRRAIGVEIDPKYCEVARRRVAEAATPLFDLAGGRES